MLEKEKQTLMDAGNELEREIRHLRAELAVAHAETVDVRNKWFQTCEDKLKKQRTELYEVKTQLEEEKGKNRELTARINRDYTNSSKSSSQSPNHGKIHNGREKTGEFLKAVSGGKLELSAGMICGLSKEFSEKTQEERDDLYLKLLSSPYMHVDFTFGRVNGKQGSVMVCVSDGHVLSQEKEKKGHEGVKARQTHEWLSCIDFHYIAFLRIQDFFQKTYWCQTYCKSLLFH